MAKQAEITYLLNSGFLVKLNQTVLVFDYYIDPENHVERALEDCSDVYFFSSHAHLDHFNSDIRTFADRVNRYFFGFDIKADAKAQLFPQEKVTYLDAYDECEAEGLHIITYSSTDEGISFLVEIDGWKIYHAGDFNWWHWKGDTQENNQFAKNKFMKQMKKMDGLKADIAFFPVDSRLEDYLDIGAKEFCRRTDVNYLITMHNTKGDVWRPAPNFFSEGKTIPVWSPVISGENIKIMK